MRIVCVKAPKIFRKIFLGILKKEEKKTVEKIRFK